MVVVRVVIAGQGDGGAVAAATAGCTHAQLTSIDRILSSRPASTSTSALPQGHNMIKSCSSNSASQAPAVRRAGAHVEIESGTVGDGALGGKLETELHGIGHDRAQRADFEFDAVHAAPGRVFTHRIDNTLR